jgi:hypothetical protein
MFVLFIGLVLGRLLFKDKMDFVLKALDVPCGFCLRWLNLLFSPSFVTLPLSPRVAFTEVLKIAAVFGIHAHNFEFDF